MFGRHVISSTPMRFHCRIPQGIIVRRPNAHTRIYRIVVRQLVGNRGLCVYRVRTAIVNTNANGSRSIMDGEQGERKAETYCYASVSARITGFFTSEIHVPALPCNAIIIRCTQRAKDGYGRVVKKWVGMLIWPINWIGHGRG